MVLKTRTKYIIFFVITIGYYYFLTSSLRPSESLISESKHEKTETKRTDQSIKRSGKGQKRAKDSAYKIATRDTVFSRNIILPQTLDNLRNPCWFEPKVHNFSYKNTYFYRDCPKPTNDSLIIFDKLQKYYEKKSKRLRCYPYFFLIGVQKCGTTDLCSSLRRYHPHIVDAIVKEPQYWTRRIHGICRAEYAKGIQATFDDYLTLFDNFVLKARLAEGVAVNPRIIGDCTPSNINLLHQWRNIPGNEGRLEPNITLAHILHNVRPDTKVLAILRDPVDRLLSNYKHDLRYTDSAITPAGFHDAVKHQIQDLEQCITDSNLRACVYDLQSALTKGIYHIFVRDWISVFSTEQVLIVRFEDYKVNRLQVLEKIISFLELDPSMSRDKVAGKVIGNYRTDAMAMLPETRSLARRFYDEHTRELEELLGYSMSWSDRNTNTGNVARVPTWRISQKTLKPQR